MTADKTALLVIDVQNDYFADGGFPLWEADETLERILQTVGAAREIGLPVILIQHIAEVTSGPAPFFNPHTPGVAIHPRLLAAAPDAPIVIKHDADSFHHTVLADTLSALGVQSVLICGMMTQNCVTHTAISRAADAYDVTVLADGCTTVSQMLHVIALKALSTRTRTTTSAKALAPLRPSARRDAIA